MSAKARRRVHFEHQVGELDKWYKAIDPSGEVINVIWYGFVQTCQSQLPIAQCDIR